MTFGAVRLFVVAMRASLSLGTNSPLFSSVANGHVFPALDGGLVGSAGGYFATAPQ